MTSKSVHIDYGTSFEKSCKIANNNQLIIHNSVVMTVLSWGILLFSFSFLVLIASEETNQGEILSRSVVIWLLMRFWLFTEERLQFTEEGWGIFDLLLFTVEVTDDKDRVTGWFDAKEVS